MNNYHHHRNVIRLSVLLLDFGRDVLCGALRLKLNTLNDLRDLLNNNKRSLLRELQYSQKRILYPTRTCITDIVYGHLDFSSICVLLKTYLKSTKVEDDLMLKHIDTLMFQKQRLFGTSKCTIIDDKMFYEMWLVLKKTLVAIGTDCFGKGKLEQKIDDIYDMSVTVLDEENHETFKLQTVSEQRRLPTEKSYTWTVGRVRFVEILGWLDVASVVMRTVLSQKIPMEELKDNICEKPYMLANIKPFEKQILLQMAGNDADNVQGKEDWYKSLDFTSLFISLRYWGYIPMHSKGWGKPPDKTDTSLSADLERMRLTREQVLNHKDGTEMQEKEYIKHKKTLTSAIQRICDDYKEPKVKVTMKELFEESLISEYTQLKHRQQDSKEKGNILVHSISLPLTTESNRYNDIESLQQECKDADDNKSQTNASKIVCHEDIRKNETWRLNDKKQIVLEEFITQHRDALANAFLGFYCDKPDDIFIVAYLKQTVTKSKYWSEFNHVKVLYIDSKIVDSEAAEAIYSKESLENKIKFEDIEKMAALITENSDNLMKKHTNLQMISGCSVRSRKKMISLETCIVFYCRTKGVIPFGEEKFPTTLGEYNVDVREGLFNWTPGDVPLQSPNDYHHTLKMGCNIGMKVKPGERVWNGSLGGFVESKYGLGFLTCAHVLYDEVRLQENKPKESDFVVQPAGDKQDYECGKVVKTAFDPTGPVGVDASLVLVTKSNRVPEQGWFTGLSQDNMEFAGFNFNEPLLYNSGRIRRLRKEDMGRRVIKSGRATNLTRGSLSFCGTAVKIFDTQIFLNRGLNITHSMKGQIEILSFHGVAFAQPGDSGSLVFLVDDDTTLKCIGMVEGWTTYFSAIVTPIIDILEKLDLDNTQLYKFPDPPSMEVE